MAKRKTKYNSKKVEIDGITFDSKAEGEYYERLKELQEQGKIDSFSLQPEFELQPAFTKNGKRWLPIKYEADFLIAHNDGTKEVIDVKGFETPDFKLKQKIFEHKYGWGLTLVSQAPKYLAPIEWIELDELKEIRRKRKKVTKEYGRKKSPEKEKELQKITDEFLDSKGESAL